VKTGNEPELEWHELRILTYGGRTIGKPDAVAGRISSGVQCRCGRSRHLESVACSRGSAPPKPWNDEYPALTYGANCPQRLHSWTSEQTFLYQWTDGWQSEDMLRLNIWTPSLTGKRPVMFYIHDGGFTFGSACELASQDGARMARHHDVVSVTVNHRLNVLGFLDVSSIGGPQYSDSVNVGMTDLTAALRWVRDNIANLGSDPVARKGDPGQPGLKWEPFEPARGRTMVFDSNCRMTDDPEAEIR